MLFQNGDHCIHYITRGDSGGLPIFILHAMGTDHRAMEAWLEPVFEQTKGFRRIYVDLPGHGGSRVGESGLHHSDEILDLLLSFVDYATEGSPFALLGKSFGGYMAQGIYGKRTNLVKGLALLVTPMHQITERHLPAKTVLVQEEGLLNGIPEDIALSFDTLMTVQTKEHLTRFLEEIQPGRTLADRAFLTSKWRTEGYFFSEDPLGGQQSNDLPALFLFGRQDAICGYEDQKPLLELFPRGTWAVLEGAGHMIDMEQRPLVQALVAEWLARCSK